MILITGGAGYIGAVLTEKLVQKDLSVTVFDRFYFGKSSLEHLQNKIKIIEGDIRTFNEELLTNVEIIIHLAALSNDPTAEFNPLANYQINTEATVRLAKIAKKKGVKKFIFASSCSIYDTGFENGSCIKNEQSRVRPKAAYSLSKYQAEKALLELAGKNFCVVILRKGTVFGYSPRMRYDLVVNTMVKDALSQGIIKIFAGGLEWRPLVAVEDAAQAYWAALTAPASLVNGQIFNIALDNFLVKDLAYLIQKILDNYFSIKTKTVFVNASGLIRSYRVSNQKIAKILNFKPKVSVEESVKKMVEKISNGHFADFANPLYYNIALMRPILEKETGQFLNLCSPKNDFITEIQTAAS